MNFGLIIVGDEILSGKRATSTSRAWSNARRTRPATVVGELPRRRSRATDGRRWCAVSRPAMRCSAAAASAPRRTITPGSRPRPRSASNWRCTRRRGLIAERTAEMAREGRGTADMTPPENRQRLKMGEFPVGAEIVPNPFNRIPGFAIRNHFFVPGFPVMAWPMIESVLDARFAHLFHRDRQAELLVHRARSGRVDRHAADGGRRAGSRRQGVQPAVDGRGGRATPHRARREGTARRSTKRSRGSRPARANSAAEKPR